MSQYIYSASRLPKRTIYHSPQVLYISYKEHQYNTLLTINIIFFIICLGIILVKENLCLVYIVL